jgi:hypothetical protein
MRLVGEYRFPKYSIEKTAREFVYMGQDLMNPPSVEGWHTGKEWIDTGILVERVNFTAAAMGDIDKPGIRRIIERLREQGELSPEELVDGCLELVGPLRVAPGTRTALVIFAEQDGPLDLRSEGRAGEERVGALLSLIAATREFQFV